jgi:tetratricopeptide (TPR) repeat protein
MSAARKQLQSIMPTTPEEAIGLEMLILFERRTSDVYFDADRVTPKICRDLYDAYINTDIETKKVVLPTALHHQLANLLVEHPLPAQEIKKISQALDVAEMTVLSMAAIGAGGATASYHSQTNIEKKAQAILKQQGTDVTFSMTPEMISAKYKDAILRMFGKVLGEDFNPLPEETRTKNWYRQIFYPCYLFNEAANRLTPNYQKMLGETYVESQILIKKLINTDIPKQEISEELAKGDLQFRDIKMLFGCAIGFLRKLGLSKDRVTIPLEKSILYAGFTFHDTLSDYGESLFREISTKINIAFGIKSEPARSGEGRIIILGPSKDAKVDALATLLYFREIKTIIHKGKILIEEIYFDKVLKIAEELQAKQSKEKANPSASAAQAPTQTETKSSANGSLTECNAIHFATGYREKALAVYDNAIKEHKGGHFPEAIALFEESIKLFSLSAKAELLIAKAYLTLASSYRENKQFKEAKESLDKSAHICKAKGLSDTSQELLDVQKKRLTLPDGYRM